MAVLVARTYLMNIKNILEYDLIGLQSLDIIEELVYNGGKSIQV